MVTRLAPPGLHLAASHSQVGQSESMRISREFRGGNHLASLSSNAKSKMWELL